MIRSVCFVIKSTTRLLVVTEMPLQAAAKLQGSYRSEYIQGFGAAHACQEWLSFWLQGWLQGWLSFCCKSLQVS